jgi:hypothetical protein
MNTTTKKSKETDWTSYGLAALEGAAAVAAGYFLIKHGSDLSPPVTRTVIVEKPQPKSILEELLQGSQPAKKRSMIRVGDAMIDVNSIKSAKADTTNHSIVVTLIDGQTLEVRARWPEYELGKLVDAMNEA